MTTIYRLPFTLLVNYHKCTDQLILSHLQQQWTKWINRSASLHMCLQCQLQNQCSRYVCIQQLSASDVVFKNDVLVLRRLEAQSAASSTQFSTLFSSGTRLLTGVLVNACEILRYCNNKQCGNKLHWSATAACAWDSLCHHPAHFRNSHLHPNQSLIVLIKLHVN